MDNRYSDKYTNKEDDNSNYSVDNRFGGDEGLPEVCIDNAPQALSNREATLNMRQFGDRHPKYPVVYDNAPKEFDSNGGLLPSQPEASRKSPGAVAIEGKGNICGLRRKVFLVVLGIVIVIMVAAIGGGVGGAMSNSKSKKDTPVVTGSGTSSSIPSSSPSLLVSQSQSSISTGSTSPSSSLPTSTTPITSTPSSSPTVAFLNNQTGTGNALAFQGFSGLNYQGNPTNIVHDEAGTDFGFDLNSYVWLPNSTACCVSFCSNATDAGVTGWWCDARYQPKASVPFSRIFVWCGKARTDANAKCV